MSANPGYLIADRLFLYVANGVTTVRDMMSGPSLLMLQRRVERGEVLGPRIYTARLVATDQWGLGEFQARLAEVKAEGYDFAKYYGRMEDRERFDSFATASQRTGLPIVGHVMPAPGVEGAFRSRLASIEHLWGYVECVGFVAVLWETRCNGRAGGETMAPVGAAYRLDEHRLRLVAMKTRLAQVWNTPTLQVVDSSWRGWHQQIVQALAEAGAGLLLGTDIPNLLSPTPMLAGFSIHRELELFVAAGLSPYQALESGTRNAAAFLGTLDSTGTVALGKRADLLLLDDNPLQDIRSVASPAGVMVNGTWLSRERIEGHLRAMMHPAYVETIDPNDAPLPFFGPAGFTKNEWQGALADLVQTRRHRP